METAKGTVTSNKVRKLDQLFLLHIIEATISEYQVERRSLVVLGPYVIWTVFL